MQKSAVFPFHSRCRQLVLSTGLDRSVDDSDDDEPEISSEDEQQDNNSDVELSD